MDKGSGFPTSDLFGSFGVNAKSGGETKKDSIENVVNLKHHPSLRIHHIDVGQGESTVVEYRVNGKPHWVMLIDGGRYTRGGGTIVRYLRELGILKIDVMVCTHHDADHIEGLNRVLEDEYNHVSGGLTVDVVIDRNPDMLTSAILSTEKSLVIQEYKPPPKVEPDANGEKFVKPEIKKKEERAISDQKSKQQLKEEEDLRAAVTRFVELTKGKKVFKTSPGLFIEDTRLDPNFKVTCLHCNSTGTNPLEENNYSIAFLIEFGEFRYYTGGDLESGVEDKLIPTIVGGKHLCSFKCGHHGSKNSTSPAFLSQTKATHAVISCGRHSYYHPDPELVQRLCDAPDLRWFDLTNCFYNRRGINPGYLNQEIALLKTLIVKCVRGAKAAKKSVKQLRKEAFEQTGKGKTFKDQDVEDALASIDKLQLEMVGVRDKAVSAQLMISVLADKDDPGCTAAIDEAKAIEPLSLSCNQLVAANKDLRVRANKVRNENDLDGWNQLVESVVAGVRRCHTLVKACSQLCGRFTTSKQEFADFALLKGVDPPIRGFVAGAQGYFGMIVLDVIDLEALKVDHQFAVGVYNGGWIWKPVRCLATLPAPPVLTLPGDDFSTAVEIETLKKVTPWSPGIWSGEIEETDKILDFSENTGASGAQAKKEKLPPSEQELKEQRKIEEFMEQTERKRQVQRNRSELGEHPCEILSCTEKLFHRGLAPWTCSVCGAAMWVHRFCLSANGCCPNCGKRCDVCGNGLDLGQFKCACDVVYWIHGGCQGALVCGICV